MVANSPEICTILTGVHDAGAGWRLDHGAERGADRLADRERLNAMLGHTRALDPGVDAGTAGAIE